MFTTCPECGTVFRIGPAQLRAAEGFVRCGTCAATFNALLSLADEPPAGAGGTESPGSAAAGPSFATGAIPPIVARTPEAPGPVSTLPRTLAPASPAAIVAQPVAAPPAPPAPAPAPTLPAPPALSSRADEPPDDAGELAIPDDFGPESWDDTLDLPRPAAQRTLPNDDALGDDDDAPAGFGQIADDPLFDDIDDEPEAGGDSLAGVVEHADWESLLTGLDDDEEEGAAPVYIVEDEPLPPASRPAARPATAPALAVVPALDTAPAGPAAPVAPAGPGPARAAPEPAQTGAVEDLPTLADIPWPPDEDDGDQLPPLGSLDDVLDDDETVAPLPTLGELTDDDDALDEPEEDDGPLSTLDESAEDDAPADLHEPDDDEPLPTLDEDEDEPAAGGPIPLTAAALAAAARQPAPATARAEAPAVPEPWADRPAWPPATEPAPRGRWLYGVGSLLLALALAAQVVTHQRDELATHPEWGPLVREVYTRLGMDVYPAWDLGAYEVRGSEAVAGRSAAGALDIVARLAVTGDRPVGLPLVRVTLRDRRGDVLGQRVVSSAEYLPADAALAEPVRPGTLIPVEVSLPDPGVDASGYEVDICLLTRAQGLVCQGEREPFQR
ncbi:MAG: zinc-ribbon domain-containing protein [Chromatiales bacterium]|jgi:predicted Zn finger-like uncharacterized protein|nr:zinc-ribbon domain-containing protein [Chromatiales bacterium]